MKIFTVRNALILLGVLLLTSFLWSLSRTSIAVDLAKVRRGPLNVAVEEDGKTKIKDRYTVSSPLLGTLLRIDLEPGDKVYGGTTQVAILQPTSPNFLDEREKAQAEASQKAAELAVQRAEADLQKTREALSLAEKNRQRVLALKEKASVSQQEIDIAETEYRVQLAAISVAELAGRISVFEFEQAKAALLHHTTEPNTNPPLSFSINSPIDGEVLRVFQESRAVIHPGTPLLEVGDPSLIEIETDVLSTDAVKITPGNEVIIEQWGQDRILNGIVRRVEPAAFTKVSSLGVEEQRVNVVIDIVEPASERSSLGDGYQVNTKIIYWKTDDCLQIPLGALVRVEETWCVYRVKLGKAELVEVQLGHRNRENVEILSGISESDEVIVYPSDDIADGCSIHKR
jgi:HlyD family secretion protein